MVKCDLDSILSYQTAKVVRIKDKRLGLLHYGFICLILGYIVGYQVLYNKMYLDLETPIGSVRTSLLRGQNMTRERLSNFPYCLSATNPSVNDFPNLPCIFWKEGDALYPPTEQTAMFITTRVNITDWALNCSLLEPNCTFHKVMNTSYYVGGIDRFTIMLDHTMYASKLGIQANAKSLPGRLLDQKEDEVRDLQKPNSFGQEGKNDILEVRTLLKVAGVSLDDYSATSSTKETNRYAGVLLLVFIVYDNTHSFNTNDIRYTVKIREVKNTEFKSLEEIYFSETSKRERNRHGVRLIFLQTGQLGKFQFQVLLLTMVSGLALLAVSTLVVDLLALMVLPQRKYYEKYKYYDVDFEKMASQDEMGQTRVNVVSTLEEPLIANKE